MKLTIGVLRDIANQSYFSRFELGPNRTRLLCVAMADLLLSHELADAYKWVPVTVKMPPKIDSASDFSVKVHVWPPREDNKTIQFDYARKVWTDLGEVTHWTFPTPPPTEAKK